MEMLIKIAILTACNTFWMWYLLDQYKRYSTKKF